MARSVLLQPALAPFSAGPVIPVRDDLDDAGLADFVRAKAESVYRPVGTCGMGRGAESVVDPQLRVHGVDGLGVVDESVMPPLPGAT